MPPLFWLIVVSLGVVAGRMGAQQSNYVSPVDGQGYRADWKEYSPKPGPKKAEGPVRLENVRLENVRLLSTQEEFGRNVDVPELAKYCNALVENVAKSVDAPVSDFGLMLQVSLTAGARPVIEMASKGEPGNELLQKIHDGLKTLPDLRSKADEVKFEVQIAVTK